MVETGLGQTIRDARVRGGITIDQLSSVTKISPTILRAMEAENFDRLRGGVFTRAQAAVDSAESAAPRTTPELRLEIRAIGSCWMSAAADGAPVAARLLDAGDTETIAAHDEIRLRLGDPTSVSFALNGVAGRSLGDSGHAVSIHITPQNAAEFQAR